MRTRFLRQLAVTADGLGFTSRGRRRSTRPYLLGLAYHRVGRPVQGFDPETWSATTEDFDLQVKHLSLEFDVVTPDDLPDILPRPRGRYVMITFDDGYRDNAELALPILQAHRTRAAFFVVTGFIGSTRLAWWDRIADITSRSRGRRLELPPWLERPMTIDGGDEAPTRRALLRVYKALPSNDATAFLDALEAWGQLEASEVPSAWMTWDQVRALRAAGMHIGGHSHLHPIMSRLDAKAQISELDTCATRFAEEIGAPMRSFAYPVGERGAFDDNTRRALTALDVRFAATYHGGLNDWARWDPYDVKRIGVESYHGISLFRSMVSWPRLLGRI